MTVRGGFVYSYHRPASTDVLLRAFHHTRCHRSRPVLRRRTVCLHTCCRTETTRPRSPRLPALLARRTSSEEVSPVQGNVGSLWTATRGGALLALLATDSTLQVEAQACATLPPLSRCLSDSLSRCLAASPSRRRAVSRSLCRSLSSLRFVAAPAVTPGSGLHCHGYARCSIPIPAVPPSQVPAGPITTGAGGSVDDRRPSFSAFNPRPAVVTLSTPNFHLVATQLLMLSD